jgi:hypothetical protein
VWKASFGEERYFVAPLFLESYSKVPLVRGPVGNEILWGLENRTIKAQESWDTLSQWLGGRWPQEEVVERGGSDMVLLRNLSSRKHGQ